jgi:hypothetical protein
MSRPHTIFFMAVMLTAAAALAGTLKVSESTIDYGTVKEGSPIIKKVILANTGAQTLAIANAAAS